MGANIKFLNKKIVCGEKIADISVKSQKRINTNNRKRRVR